jgi:hypothetical protein
MSDFEHFEDARKERLLQWLVTPPSQREPATQVELAAELGVAPRTLRDWRANVQFRAVWEQQAKRVIGDPSNVQEVLEEMRQLALLREVPKGVDREGNQVFGQNTQQVAAAKLYLTATDAIRPPEADAAAKKAAEMSDAELQAMIAQQGQKMLSERQAAANGR